MIRRTPYLEAPPALAAAGSDLTNPSAWFTAAVGGMPVKSGQRVTVTTAMQTSAVFACVRVLAESVATLPLSLYRRSVGPDGAERRAVARDHPLHALLHDRPNPRQTSFEFREMLMGHLALRGNAFARQIRDGRGRLVALWPMHPDRVTVREAVDGDGGGRLFYDWSPSTGGSVTLAEGEVLHLRGLSDDGKVGVSPLRLMRETVGLTLAAEEYGARLFANGARPSVALKHPGKLSPEAATRLKDGWARANGGASIGGTAVLDEGMSVEQLGMSQEDAQYIELRGFQVEEIARAFRVPLVLLGHGDKAPTYASVEQFMISFVMHTLMPWLTRWEQAIARDLVLDGEDDLYPKFNMDALLRGTTKERYDAYAVALTNGILSVNDVRAREDLDPVDGGDGHLRPLNLTPVGAPPPAPPAPARPPVP